MNNEDFQLLKMDTQTGDSVTRYFNEVNKFRIGYKDVSNVAGEYDPDEKLFTYGRKELEYTLMLVYHFFSEPYIQPL